MSPREKLVQRAADHADAVPNGVVRGWQAAGRWSAGVGTAGSLWDSETNDGKRLNDYIQIDKNSK